MTEEKLKAKSNAILDKLEEGGFDLGDWSIEDAHNNGFIDGYHECQNEHEWHYVKDELPRKSDSTLCELMPVFVAVKVGYRVSTYGTYWNLKIGKFECLDEVYAWCYTPEPPELPKDSE